jgi:class 3 adenylate cyclase
MIACARCGQENPDGFRFCGACAAELAPQATQSEVRKVVTAVFCDVVGSTPLGERLDPEIVRAVMGRYFVEMQAVVEGYGGRVSKFIGDAVLALFGVPALHEDDALRAVCAAAEMQERMGALNEALRRDFGVELGTRIGVATGSVVVAADDEVVLGDVLNTASRLEQAAEPGTVLIVDATYRLVRHAISAAAVDALRLKGKAPGTCAWRLVAVDRGASGVRREFGRALIGRDRELNLLRQAFARAVEERRCGLVTVLAHPGVGKSRLALEFAAVVGPSARVMVGHCLSYGEGITYAPLAEMVRSAARDMDALRSLMGDAEDAARVALLVAASVGFTDEPTEGEETPWAYRRLFETLAEAAPLVLVFEDIHWAEPALLELIEYVVDWASEERLLVLCLARPELLERCPGWGGGRVNAVSALLEPLSDADAKRMLDDRLRGRDLAASVRSRIEAVARGVPLFIEQMIAMLGEVGRAEDVAIPPAVQALLAARLDNLAVDERAVLECAAIEGETFTVAAVAALGAEPATTIASMLGALRRRELIHGAGGGRFRFAHALLRDAAYDRIPKRRRGELHRQFAAWLGEADPADELIGHHVEQAVLLRVELGDRGDETRALARDAAERLAAAARRAKKRADDHAAANLLERAIALLADDQALQLSLLPELGAVLSELDPARALPMLDDAIAAALTAGADAVRWRCVVLRSHLLMLTRPNERPFDALLEEAEGAADVLERLGDRRGLADARGLMTDLNWCLGRAQDWSNVDRAGEVADAGTSRTIAHAAFALAAIGSPLSRVEAELRELLVAAGDNQATQAFVRACLGRVMVCRDQPAAGREMTLRARDQLVAMGQRLWASEATFQCAEAEWFTGDLAAAEREFARARRELEAADNLMVAAGAIVYQALMLCELGRTAEALRLIDPPPSIYDLECQMRVHHVHALAHLARGEHDRALTRIDDALRVVAGGHWADMPGRLLIDRATILRALDRGADAREALEAAALMAAERGNQYLANRVRQHSSRIC